MKKLTSYLAVASAVLSLAIATPAANAAHFGGGGHMGGGGHIGGGHFGGHGGGFGHRGGHFRGGGWYGYGGPGVYYDDSYDDDYSCYWRHGRRYCDYY